MKFKRQKFRIDRPIKPKYEQLEVELFDLIQESREDGSCVDSVEIHRRAIEFYYGDPRNQLNGSFSASKGWIHRFLKRHELVLRRTTTTGRDLPSNCLQTIDNFMDFCSQTHKLAFNSINYAKLTQDFSDLC